MRDQARARTDRMAYDDVEIGRPLVVDVRMLGDDTGAALNVERRTRRVEPPEHTRTEGVPCDRKAFEPVAQMPRFVMKEAGDLSLSDAPRRRELEDVVPLIRIERTEFVAENRLVVRNAVDAANDVVDHIDLATKVRVPREPRIVDLESVRGEMELGARQELGRRRS